MHHSNRNEFKELSGRLSRSIREDGLLCFLQRLRSYASRKANGLLFGDELGRVDQTVKAAQAAVAELLGPEHYYHTYRKHELSYWGPAIPWLKELKDVKNVLDVGAAYGTLSVVASQLYPGTKLHIIDPVEYLNPLLRERYGIKTFRGDIERDAFPEIPKCDLLIFTEVLEHLNFHPVPTLRKLHSMMTSTAHLLLSTPAAESAWGRVEDSYASVDEIPEYQGQDVAWIDQHIYQYSLDELNAVFPKPGLLLPCMQEQQN